MSSDINEYLTETQLAVTLGLAKITCQTRRLKRKDWIPHYKVGRRVLYAKRDVEAFMAAKRVA